MGHTVVKKELISIIRRFDLDGDQVIGYQEFKEGVVPVLIDIKPKPIQMIENSPVRERSRVEEEKTLQ